MKHPSSLDLEAFACGDDLANVREHLSSCAECTRFVEKIRAASASFDPAPLLARTSRPAASSNLRLLVWTAIPLAAAAALVFALRKPQLPESTGPIAMRTSEGEPTTTFKGHLHVAAIRDRHGEQSRFTNSVKVRAGDRLRLEVALDRSTAILAGVLADDGTFVTLMPAAVRDPGTHFSDEAVRFDAEPTSGTILVGTPEAVERARKNADPNVASMRVEWERP